MKQPEKQKQKMIARHAPSAVTKQTKASDPTAASKQTKTVDPPAALQPDDLSVLPIERVTMPTDDVSDLRDVVDAINRLCETMKTSDYDDSDGNNDVEVCEKTEMEVKVESEVELVNPEQIVVCEVETYVAELWSDAASLHIEGVDADADSSTHIDTVSTLDIDSYLIRNEDSASVAIDRSTGVEHAQTLLNISRSCETILDNVVSDSFVTANDNLHNVVSNQLASRVESVVSVASDFVVYDQDLITASFEPVSEMYYTASSEVSLLSDVELPDRIQEEAAEGRETLTRDDRNGVMAGHVAAMRERFESMTRANTPCPDIMRSMSPSLDVYRNITPSPDHLG